MHLNPDLTNPTAHWLQRKVDPEQPLHVGSQLEQKAPWSRVFCGQVSRQLPW